MGDIATADGTGRPGSDPVRSDLRHLRRPARPFSDLPGGGAAIRKPFSEEVMDYSRSRRAPVPGACGRVHAAPAPGGLCDDPERGGPLCLAAINVLLLGAVMLAGLNQESLIQSVVEW